MKTADEFLSEGAATFKARNKVYGNNYLNVGRAMTGFFPNGVSLKTEDDFNRFHLFMLVIVKLSRYTNNWDAGGHADSIHDAMVYCAMVESVDANIEERKSWYHLKKIFHFLIHALGKNQLTNFEFMAMTRKVNSIILLMKRIIIF